MSLSIWERESLLNNADVVVIGSGIVGLNAALALKEREPNLGVYVIERGTLPNGASTKNAGFACFGSVTELLDDLEQHSEAEVFGLVQMRYRGLQRLRQRLGDAVMDYAGHGNYELFLDAEEAEYERCMDRLDYLNRQMEAAIGEKSVFSRCDERIKGFGFGGVRHLVWNRAEGQIDTGKTMRALIEKAQGAGIRILNGLTVTQVEDLGESVLLHTQEGWNWRVGRVLVATNGFARRLMPELAVTPARNQVLITQPIDNLRFKGCFHYNKGYVYFRNVGNRILLGGGRHLDLQNEETDAFGLTELIQNYQLDMLERHISPQQAVAVDYRWSGILGVGDQKKPILQQLSPRVTVAVRMGGMGVAIGSLVGEEGARLVLEG